MPGGVPVYCDYGFQYRDIIVTFCLYFNRNTRFKPDECYVNFVWGVRVGVNGEHSHPINVDRVLRRSHWLVTVLLNEFTAQFFSLSKFCRG
jgi:hypothetical protein